MSNQVDVLAVMDEAAGEQLCGCGHPRCSKMALQSRIFEARAAVAELVAKGDAVGKWLSAAIDDEHVCAEFKADALAFLTAMHAVVAPMVATEASK